MLLALTLSKKELMLRKFDYPSFQDLGLKACSSTLITPKIFLKDKWAASKGKNPLKMTTLLPTLPPVSLSTLLTLLSL